MSTVGGNVSRAAPLFFSRGTDTIVLFVVSNTTAIEVGANTTRLKIVLLGAGLRLNIIFRLAAYICGTVAVFQYLLPSTASSTTQFTETEEKFRL